MTEVGSKTVLQMLEDHGVTVGGICMLLQLAEAMDGSKSVTIEGKALEDTLTWYRAWKEKAEKL